MDYWSEVERHVHVGFEAFAEVFAEAFAAKRVFAFTTKATRAYSEVSYQAGDVLLFGPESRGLPEVVRALGTPCRIPMREGTRSLNLAVSAGVALYEAWRQQGFAER